MKSEQSTSYSAQGSTKENSEFCRISQCLWPTLVDDVVHYPSLSADIQVDVCVIGGGFTGLSSALHLTEYGKRVCVLEAHTIGNGGSGRNVGLVNAGTWARPDDLNQY